MVLYIYVLQKSWIHLEVYKAKLEEKGNHNQKHGALMPFHNV
jgi:hypothetical protein